MPNRWQRKELDVEILKLIYQHKALIGKTVGVILERDYDPSLNENKVYARLAGLCKVNLMERNLYKITSKKACRKGATLYALTPTGVQELQKMGLPVKYKPVRARDLDGLFMRSKILEMIPLKLINGAIYKAENKLQNFGLLDFYYNGYELVIQKSTDKQFEKILVAQAKSLEKDRNRKRLYLCKSRPQMITLIKRFMAEHINTGQFVVYKDVDTIVQILEGRAQPELDERVCKEFNLEKLTPEQYEQPDGRITKVYNLIGYNPKVIRCLKKEMVPSYVGFAHQSDAKYLAKKFPNILENHIIVPLDQELVANVAVAPEYEPEYDPWKEAFEC